MITASTFAGSNTMDISQWLPGTYTVLRAGAAMSAADLNTFQNFTVGGNALGAGMTLAPSLDGGDKNLIVTAQLGLDNQELVWGGTSGPWNYTDQNWTNSGSAANFLPGDAAWFNSVAAQTVTLGGDSISLSGLKITGGADYTFTGGALHIDSSAAQNLPGSVSYADGLVKYGSGTLTLATGSAANHNLIAGDVHLTDGQTILANGFTQANSSLTINSSGDSYLGQGTVAIDLNRPLDRPVFKIIGGGVLELGDSVSSSTLRLTHSGLTSQSGQWLIVDGAYTSTFGSTVIGTASLSGQLVYDPARVWFDGEYTVAGDGSIAGFDRLPPNAQRVWPGFQDAFFNRRTPFMGLLDRASGPI